MVCEFMFIALCVCLYVFGVVFFCLPQARDRCGHAKLELSDLNREPAMPYALRALLAYHGQFGLADRALPAPQWAPEVASLLARGQPRNLRLFALKVQRTKKQRGRLLLFFRLERVCKSHVRLKKD